MNRESGAPAGTRPRPAGDYRPVRRAPAWLVAYGTFLFRTRDAVFPLAMVLLAIASPPLVGGSGGTTLRWLDAIGLTMAAAGQALRAAVVGYRYIVRGGRHRQVYAEGLVTTGFFALSRNPLYLGNLVIVAGLFTVWGSTLMFAVGAPFFLLGYRAIVAAEESYLGQEYGAEFDDYCARVPRWWPAVGRLRDATAGMAFNWPRVVIKEYGSAAYWTTGAVVMLMFKERGYARLESRPPRLLPWLLALGVIATLWGVARFLKKTKKLRDSVP